MRACYALELLATLGIVARVLRSLWLLLAVFAVVVARRRLGAAYHGKFMLGVVPTDAWKSGIPGEHWPEVSRLVVRLRVLLGLLVLSEALWLCAPLAERTMCARCPCGALPRSTSTIPLGLGDIRSDDRFQLRKWIEPRSFLSMPTLLARPRPTPL
jgi:hypothetical protein